MLSLFVEGRSAAPDCLKLFEHKSFLQRQDHESEDEGWYQSRLCDVILQDRSQKCVFVVSPHDIGGDTVSNRGEVSQR